MNKKKINRKDYIFESRKNEILFKMPGQIDGLDFNIIQCVDCEIYLCDHFAQVLIDDCVNCKIYIGPTEGAIFIRDSKQLNVSSASSQFRISDCQDIRAFAFSLSDPALENSVNIQLAPYNFVFPNIQLHFQAAKLDLSKNYWSQVYDFTPNKQKRNWSIMSPDLYPGQIVKQLEGVEGDLINPVPIPRCYGGDSDLPIIVGSQDPGCQEQGDMISFSIQTTAQQAEEIIEQKIQEQEQKQEFDVNQEQSQRIQQQPPSQLIEQSGQDFFDQQPIQQYQQNQQQSQDLFGSTQASQYFEESQSIQANASMLSQKLAKDREIQLKIEQEQINEVNQKRDLQTKAQEFLRQWKIDQQKLIQQNKKRNREEQDVLIQAKQAQKSKQQPWDIVTSNIELKVGAYPGTKDVQRMRESIINKKADNSQK